MFKEPIETPSRIAGSEAIVFNPLNVQVQYTDYTGTQSQLAAAAAAAAASMQAGQSASVQIGPVNISVSSTQSYPNAADISTEVSQLKDDLDSENEVPGQDTTEILIRHGSQRVTIRVIRNRLSTDADAQRMNRP